MKIGAQLYTVREHTQNLKDFAETLKKVAEIGYTTVQVSTTCAFEPEWLRKQLAACGLRCVLTHTPRERLLADPAAVAAEHDVFDCQYVGLDYYEMKDEESYARFLADFRPVAQVLRENGKYFMYHNHDQEFKKHNGKLIIESLAEDFSPDEMGFTLDAFWVQAGGGDPAQWLERLSGRVPCIHLKDYSFGRKMSVIGEGNINFDRVFEKAESAGTKYMLVEQDDCNGEDPFDCLKRSYEYLKSRGF